MNVADSFRKRLPQVDLKQETTESFFNAVLMEIDSLRYLQGIRQYSNGTLQFVWGTTSLPQLAALTQEGLEQAMSLVQSLMLPQFVLWVPTALIKKSGFRADYAAYVRSVSFLGQISSWRFTQEELIEVGVTRIFCSCTYFFGFDLLHRIRRAFTPVIIEMRQKTGSKTEDVCQAVADFISSNVTYSCDNKGQGFNTHSVYEELIHLTGNKATGCCQASACLAKLMLQLSGIESQIVFSHSQSVDGHHAWTYVRTKKDHYSPCDYTWGKRWVLAGRETPDMIEAFRKEHIMYTPSETDWYARSYSLDDLKHASYVYDRFVSADTYILNSNTLQKGSVLFSLDTPVQLTVDGVSYINAVLWASLYDATAGLGTNNTAWIYGNGLDRRNMYPAVTFDENLWVAERSILPIPHHLA